MGRWIAYLSLCVALHAASEGPALSASDVVNAADHSAGRVAPGEIVVLYPRNAGPAVLAGAQLDSDGRAATMLGDTRVWFDGIAAPMVYSVTGQVSAVVPYAVAGRKTTQVVVEYQGVRSPAVELAVVPSAPALFTLDSTGQDQAAMLNEKGCCNSARNPAVRGAFAALYATGAGQTTPSGIDGAMAAFDRAADYPVPALPVRVTVGGRPAEIQYAGAAPHAVAGLLQVNFRVPADAPTGDAVPLVLMVGGARSPEGVTMAVRSAVERVLVAEPDAVVRGWLTRVLAGAGYDVEAARNGREAVARAEEHLIDLVICSLAIPEAERTEGMRAILAMRPAPKVVATAGALGPRTLQAADLLGAQAVLRKPLSSKMVLEKVRELLRSRPTPYTVEEQGEGKMAR
jgi:uncharacterized protein (TIGR03437 family)